MASLGLTFDVDNTESVSFEELEPGNYVAEVLDTEVKATNDGNGTLLVVQWKVMEGERMGARIWQNFNIQNASAQAQRIGQGQLKQLCEALGITGHMEDSADLHGGQALIVVQMGKSSKGKDGKEYPARPEVKAVKALNAAPPAGKPAPQQQAAAPAQRPTGAQQNRPAAQPQRAAAPGGRPWGNGQRASA